MSPEVVELALRKQRLQLRIADQRRALIHHARGIAPVLHGADRVVDGARWVRDHAPVVTGLAVFLLVTRPRFALRWARRGWLGWQMLRRTGKLLP